MSTSSSVRSQPSSSMSVSSSKMIPAASSMSLESDNDGKKSSGMSVTPDTAEQHQPIRASPGTTQPIRATPSIVVRSPETEDEEMADLSSFQIKWNTFIDPLSPMSPTVVCAGDDLDRGESDAAPMTQKTVRNKKECAKTIPPPPLLDSSSRDDATLFKQPLVSPGPSRPVSHPSTSSKSSEPKLAASKHPSLPNIADKHASSQEPSAVKATKSKGLDSILEKLTKKTEEPKEADQEPSKVPPQTKFQPLPDGPYPRRRGRKSAAQKFSLSSDSETSDRDSLHVSSTPPTSAALTKPPTTPPRRGRGRPPKNKEQSLPSPVAASSPNVTSKLVPAPAAASPKLAGRVLKLVNGSQIPKGLVPCAPPRATPPNLVPCGRPPGARLVPCKAPKHLISKMKQVTNPGPSSVTSDTIVRGPNKPPTSSLFDIDESEDILDKVQKALEKQNKNYGPRIEQSPTSEDADEDPPLTKLSKPTRTFSRVPRKPNNNQDKKEIKLVKDFNIETVVVPQETSIELPTLSMVSFDSDDPDYALVKKLGAGVKREVKGPTSATPVGGQSKGDNSVVFHVASQAMISQPTASDNLEVRLTYHLVICR